MLQVNTNTQPQRRVSVRKNIAKSLWGIYSLMALWSLLSFLSINQYLGKTEYETILNGKETLLKHYSFLIANSIIEKRVNDVEIYLDRLAGETGVRYAALTNKSGKNKVFSGQSLPTLLEKRLVEKSLQTSSCRLTMIAEKPSFWELSCPVWNKGEKWGVLRWGIWPINGMTRNSFFRLFFTWGIGALLGAGGVFYFVSKYKAHL